MTLATDLGSTRSGQHATSAPTGQPVDDLLPRIERLAATFEGAPAIRAVVQESRDLLRAFQAVEARQVGMAIADPSFPFADAQERLGSLRRAFGAIVQVALDVLRGDVAPADRVELERVVLLARTAPLTTADDVAAMRAARTNRPRRSAVA